MITIKTNQTNHFFKSLLILFCTAFIITSCNHSEKNAQDNASIDSAEVEVKDMTVSAVKNDDSPVPIKKTVAPPAVGSKEVIDMDSDNLTKAMVSKADSSITVNANIRLDHRIFGYAAADTNSRKLLLFSVFTDDVEGNPYECPFGSYYDTSGMEDLDLKFVKKEGNFVKADLLKEKKTIGSVFFDKNWVEFSTY